MRPIGFLLSSLCLIALLSAHAAGAAQQAAWTCPEDFSGEILHVANWTTYIGETTVADFEAACRAIVLYDVFSSNDELETRVRDGAVIDVTFPSDYLVGQLATDGLLLPLDPALLSRRANLSTDLLGFSFDPANTYSLPYLWGTVGVGYNREAVGGEITSWEQVWSHPGPVAWMDESQTMLGLALRLLGHDPDTDDAVQIAAAGSYLRERLGNVAVIAPDDGQDRLLNGDVDIAIEWSGDIFQIIDACACDTYAYAIPGEGANLWIDSVVIPASAENPRLAHAFIDYLLDAAVAADIANTTAYASPNAAAIEAGLIAPDLLANPAIYPSAEVMARLYFTSDAADNTVYTTEWEQVRAALAAR